MQSKQYFALPPVPHTHTCPAKIPQTPMMHRMLKTAEPTMVPTPTSPWVMKTPTKWCKAEGRPIRKSKHELHRNIYLSPSVCVSVCVYVCVFPTDDGGKQLWCGAASCHEGGPGHVLTQVQFLEEETKSTKIKEEEMPSCEPFKLKPPKL